MNITSIRASVQRIVDGVLMIILAGAVAVACVMVVNDAHAQPLDVPFSEMMDADEDYIPRTLEEIEQLAPRMPKGSRFQPPASNSAFYYAVSAVCGGQQLSYGTSSQSLAVAVYAYLHGEVSGEELIEFARLDKDATDKQRADIQKLVDEVCPPIVTGSASGA